MEQATPFLLLAANCCLMPMAFFGLGVAWSKGYIRSPIDIKRAAPTPPSEPDIYSE